MVVVSMLRGVNVSGRNKIRMDALRALYESLGLRDPQTYVQSGNVIFRTEDSDLGRLADYIGKGIEREFAFRPEIILRTANELKEVARKNPFAARAGLDPAKLLVTFLAADPGRLAKDKVLAIKTDPEELRIDGRELFIYFPKGMGRSKLQVAAIERMLNTPGTGRNWNSVTRMLEIAEKLAACG